MRCTKMELQRLLVWRSMLWIDPKFDSSSFLEVYVFRNIANHGFLPKTKNSLLFFFIAVYLCVQVSFSHWRHLASVHPGRRPVNVLYCTALYMMDCVAGWSVLYCRLHCILYCITGYIVLQTSLYILLSTVLYFRLYCTALCTLTGSLC